MISAQNQKPAQERLMANFMHLPNTAVSKGKRGYPYQDD